MRNRIILTTLPKKVTTFHSILSFGMNQIDGVHAPGNFFTPITAGFTDNTGFTRAGTATITIGAAFISGANPGGPLPTLAGVLSFSGDPVSSWGTIVGLALSGPYTVPKALSGTYTYNVIKLQFTQTASPASGTFMNYTDPVSSQFFQFFFAPGT